MGSTPETKAQTILVVDDEKEITHFLVDALAHDGTEVIGFLNPEEAFLWGKSHDFDLLITDMKMEKISGLELHEKLKVYYPDLLTILITGYQSFDSAQQAVSANIYAYVAKPFKIDELRALVKRALEKKGLLDRNKKLVEEQQVLIEKLLVANKELKKLDRLKSDFVSNVSHELRTPLTSMRNVLYNLHHGIGGSLSEKQQDYLKMMEEDTQRLSNLISDILDLSQLESGTLHLKRAPFKFQQALQDSLNLFEGERNVKHHLFFREASGEAENAWVDGDKAKIEQVLVNLISNAVKYSSEGTSIWIQTAGDGSHLRVAVKDEGLGIPAEDWKRIFNRFEQLEKMSRGGIKGTGLGLAIVKKILEMHGEGIQVESVPGKGSTFSFELPMSEVKKGER